MSPVRPQASAPSPLAPGEIVLDHATRSFDVRADAAGTLRGLFGRGARSAASAGPERIQALADVSLRIQCGETVGIIGRNGSGKSTLLKLIGGILGPDEGEVTTCGKVAALIELGAGFHPELTGRENITINGVILGLTKQEIRARLPRIVAFAEVGDFIDAPVRTYSSGMYARLGFAVAVHVDPAILLIDEVLSVGDARFTQKCHATLDAFKAAGKSIVVVSHDLSTVRRWCDEAVWLEAGRVRARGPAASVVDAYAAADGGGAGAA